MQKSGSPNADSLERVSSRPCEICTPSAKSTKAERHGVLMLVAS
jgi:hypothetical protein